LPLNMDQNRHHAFHATLTELRRTPKQLARSMAVLAQCRRLLGPP
jgi:hypothetical protein